LEKHLKFEIYALDSNQIWITTSLPNDKIVIGYKWVFKLIKEKTNLMEIMRDIKQRLVTKGYT